MIDQYEVAQALARAQVDLNECRDCGHRIMLFRSTRMNEKTNKPYWVQLNLDFSQHYKSCIKRKDSNASQDKEESTPF